MQLQPRALPAGKILASLGGALLLLSGCAKPHPKIAAVAPVMPVGHVYPVAVAVPAPVSPRIKFTAREEARAQQAFNIIGLKSALMVAALSCGQQEQYDAFMRKYQPRVLAAQHVMDAYFYKASGRYSGQKMEDAFVTQLANDQSVGGLSQGQNFCLNNGAEFDAVMALKSAQDLDRFVTDLPPGANTQVVASATPAS